jgi:hypothetical protein
VGTAYIGAVPGQQALPGGVQLPQGIGLDMSECDFVRVMGSTGQVEISRNESGERSEVLTYLQGARPGIYRFVAGRLKSMEGAGTPRRGQTRGAQEAPQEAGAELSAARATDAGAEIESRTA